MSSSSASRLNSIDALRGLAVLFMIEQHVIFWLCAHLNRNEFMYAISGLGGLAAPIFVTLSGLASTLAAERYDKSDRIFILRGFGIIGFGYLLNVLTPSWFTIGSWYVLHMIGLGIALAPILRRAPTGVLLALVFAVLVATVLIQNAWDTPLRLYNQQMADPGSPGGVVRHALAEGFFPVFPWISFFVAGLLAGRWLLGNRLNNATRLAGILLLLGAALSGLYMLGVGFTTHESWIRVFKVVPSFYPALTPISLFLMAAALFSVSGFVSLERRIAFRSSHFLVCLGRCSLSLLILHVVIIRESAVRFGFWRSFPAAETLLLTSCALACFSLLALWWRRIGFRFGAEWLLRRVSG